MMRSCTESDQSSDATTGGTRNPNWSWHTDSDVGRNGGHLYFSRQSFWHQPPTVRPKLNPRPASLKIFGILIHTPQSVNLLLRQDVFYAKHRGHDPNVLVVVLVHAIP